MDLKENEKMNGEKRIGVEQFKILLDKIPHIYYCGQTITGKVLIEFDSIIAVAGLTLNCKGEGHVKFTHRYIGLKKKCVSEELYLQHEIELIKNGRSEVEMKSNIFSFNLNLPEKLPCSFEGRYGRVRYSIQATLDISENLSIFSDKLSFTVAPIFDLNNHPLAPLPISENYTKTFMGYAEPLTISTFLPVRGYVPGQTVPLKINLKNESNINIKKIRVVLKKVVNYRSLENVRKHKEIVVEIEQPVELNCLVYDAKFDIPAIPPTGIICNLIDIEYTLKVEAYMDINEWYSKMFSKNPKIRMIIIVGTVPLKNYEDPLDTDDESLHGIDKNSTINNENDKGQALELTSSGKLQYQSSRIYRSSKPDQDDPTGDEDDSDKNKIFTPMYRVYKFKNSHETIPNRRKVSSTNEKEEKVDGTYREIQMGLVQ
ncbi:arrestin domain-containing protein 17-like [Chelonus insularis]|uniref:arrestin domain-containing protein 17-like n=1 Tax=Chelonus insularis TaxID=460826 RepID=UPI00158DEC07|nr:arrestin domain-containing protein 17-like [Chelonus insularis]